MVALSLFRGKERGGAIYKSEVDIRSRVVAGYLLLLGLLLFMAINYINLIKSMISSWFGAFFHPADS